MMRRVAASLAVLAVSLAAAVGTASAAVPATHKGYAWVGGTSERATYRWTEQGWVAARLKGGRKVWAQPFSAPWMWAWTGTAWHAIDQAQLTPRRPAAVAAAATTPTSVTLLSPATDNYKARFNPDPAQPELRTWLSFSGLTVRGVRFSVVPGQPLFARQLRMRSRDGRRTITVKVRTSSTNAALLQFRTGPQAGYTGVFMQLRNRAALRTQPVTVRLVVVDARGRTIARVRVQYRYGAALATAPASSLEHNGPGGRWFVSGRRTPTNVEIGRQ